MSLLVSCSSDSVADSDLGKKNLNGNIKRVEKKVYLAEEKNGETLKTDTLIAELDRSYNEDGNLTSLLDKFYEGGENTSFDSAFSEHKEKRKYEKNGLLSKVIFPYGEPPFVEERYDYNDAEQLIKKTEYDTEGRVKAIYKYKYNNQGDLIEEAIYARVQKEERLMEKEVVKFEDGKKVLVEYYNYKNTLTGSTEYKYYEDYYEEIGKWTYKKYDYQDRKLVWRSEPNNMEIVYEYDQVGNIIKWEDSNAGEKELYSYEYDRNNNPVREIRKSYELGKLKSIVVIETIITYY